MKTITLYDIERCDDSISANYVHGYDDKAVGYLKVTAEGEIVTINRTPYDYEHPDCIGLIKIHLKQLFWENPKTPKSVIRWY